MNRKNSDTLVNSGDKILQIGIVETINSSERNTHWLKFAFGMKFNLVQT